MEASIEAPTSAPMGAKVSGEHLLEKASEIFGKWSDHPDYDPELESTCDAMELARMVQELLGGPKSSGLPQPGRTP